MKSYSVLSLVEEKEEAHDDVHALPVAHRNANSTSSILGHILSLAAVFSACLISYLAGSHHQNSNNDNIAHSNNHNHCDDVMHELRKRAALASLELMQDDTLEAASESHLVNIESLSNIVDEAFDTVGFRGVFMELFETYRFTQASLEAANIKGWKDFAINTTMKVGGRPETYYGGIPTDRCSNLTSACSGSIMTLWHWVGSLAADKLLRDGSIRFLAADEDDDISASEQLDSARAVMAELQRITMETTRPDNLHFHSQHGFLWQYIPAVSSNFFETFPVDLAIEVCGNTIWDVTANKTMTVIPGLSVTHDCRHGLGHAVYYFLAMRQLGMVEMSPRMQLRYRGGFVLSDENLCEANRLCGQAPNEKTYRWCIDGVLFSYYDFSFGESMLQKGKKMLVHCGYKGNFQKYREICIRMQQIP